MADWGSNPYRTDKVAQGALFLGRVTLLDELQESVLTGRNAVHAVMGGRGMGKSSLAEALRLRLGESASTVLTRGPLQKATDDLRTQLGVSMDGVDPASALAEKARSAGRAVLLIDEVERVIEDSRGQGFLDNLRDAYERADGRLTIIVLGGTAVRDLLLSTSSPFLRIAGPIKVLTGLSLDETAALMRQPLELDIPDDVVEAIWTETAGHPWLVQMFMEDAVQRATGPAEVAGRLPEAIQAARARLHDIAFPIWWENLRERGQDIYQRLTRAPGAVQRADWVRTFGNDPRPWLDVLASTGLAARDDQSILLRGRLFAEWVQENWPADQPIAGEARDLDQWLDRVRVDDFERLVVRSLAAWARGSIEYSAASLRPGGGDGNAGLLLEAYFQVSALVALLQHEGRLTAEPEALSMRGQGRSDIKVRAAQDPQRRACIEVKIYGSKDTEVVRQVVGYSYPTDDFAAVISVDRRKRALRPEYERRCFSGAPATSTHEPPGPSFQPSFMTVHPREGLNPLRVWHFLVQLRDK